MSIGASPTTLLVEVRKPQAASRNPAAVSKQPTDRRQTGDRPSTAYQRKRGELEFLICSPPRPALRGPEAAIQVHLLKVLYFFVAELRFLKLRSYGGPTGRVITPSFLRRARSLRAASRRVFDAPKSQLR